MWFVTAFRYSDLSSPCVWDPTSPTIDPRDVPQRFVVLNKDRKSSKTTYSLNSSTSHRVRTVSGGIRMDVIWGDGGTCEPDRRTSQQSLSWGRTYLGSHKPYYYRFHLVTVPTDRGFQTIRGNPPKPETAENLNCFVPNNGYPVPVWLDLPLSKGKRGSQGRINVGERHVEVYELVPYWVVGDGISRKRSSGAD